MSQASTKLYVAETEALILLPLLDMQPRPVYVEATTQHKALCMLASTLHRSYGLSFSTATMLHNIYNYLFTMVFEAGLHYVALNGLGFDTYTRRASNFKVTLVLH